MERKLRSQQWYRVAELRPRLRPHAQIHRHDYRGEIWYVLQDESSNRYHRFSPIAYFVIARLDGNRSMDEIWEEAEEHLGEDRPTQDEIIQLLSQLHSTDVLQTDVVPDTQEQKQRYQKRERQKWVKYFTNPMSIKIPLYDPETFLIKTESWVKPLFSWAGFLVWLTVVIIAGILSLSHWPELTENVVERMLAPQNLLVMWLTYPLVKLVHEFGHAYATKVWGGEVHEMGVMVLVFMPVPYVDASAATAFRDRHKRMVVSAIGIMVELLLASLALFIWLNVESGSVKQFAWNVMLIGGISTLLFNGNPLLRFDGYHVLTDWISIPGLGQRSNKYWSYLFQHRLFGVKGVESPCQAKGESGWFFFYGAAAFCYRMFISFTIALFVAGKFFIVGILLALWALTNQLLIPAGKMLGFLFAGQKLRAKRGRALSISFAIALLVGGMLFVFPAPLLTVSEGVVWVPEQTELRVETDGFVEDVLVKNGQQVNKGDVLVRLSAPFLDANEKVLIARKDELQTRLNVARVQDRVQAEILKEKMDTVIAELRRVKERRAALNVSAPQAGRVVLPMEQDLAGRYIRQGQLVGYVMQTGALTVRTIVKQNDIGLILTRTESVEVRLSENIPHAYPAQILRQVPAATESLPSAALGTSGGGQFDIDPTDNNRTRLLEQAFQLDLTIDPSAVSEMVGGRVYVRFDQGSEPLAFQWYRSLKQLFLRRFGV